MKRVLLSCFLIFAASASHAVQPDEVLPDQQQEARARELSKDIRCLVCQNQSIDDSNADLAKDLRVLVRERIVAGDSDSEIFDFLVARYGYFVLLKPPVKASTYALWFGPPLVLVIAVICVFVYFRQRKVPAAAAGPGTLSKDERARLASILDGNDGDPA